jgi:hypothetical protein
VQAANQLIQNILYEVFVFSFCVSRSQLTHLTISDMKEKECEMETTDGDSEFDFICSSVKLLNEMLYSYDRTNDPSTQRFVVLEVLSTILLVIHHVLPILSCTVRLNNCPFCPNNASSACINTLNLSAEHNYREAELLERPFSKYSLFICVV